MPTRKSTNSWYAGNIVEIQLPDGLLSYGMLLKFPAIAFFDVHTNTRPSISEIVSHPVLFRIWVEKHAVSRKLWPLIGHHAPPLALLAPHQYFKQDPLSGQITLYTEGGFEQPARAEQCIGLERAAVWDPYHVVSRLADHFAGRANPYVSQLALKQP